MDNKKVNLTSLTLAISLGLMATLAGCETNSGGGGEGGETGDDDNKGTSMEQSIYLASEDGEYESN